jgi:hypothetical protein
VASCGGPGELACEGIPRCRSGLLPLPFSSPNPTCQPCGGAGQVCCESGACQGSLSCTFAGGANELPTCL